MKKLFYFSLALMTLFFRCATDEITEPVSEKVQFSLAISSEAISGGRLNAELPEGSTLMISIENATGPVLTNQRIGLLKIGNAYVTEPIELKPGSYTVSDFMVVNGSVVLFATPKQGSALASFVSKPLPFHFSVSRDKTNSIDMQVINVNSRAPEDFGYASFGIEVVQPLQISVFAGTELIAGTAELWDGGRLVHSYSLGAKVNTINYAGNADKLYTLKVSANGGYAAFSRTVSYNDLINELDGAPLKVMLQPALVVSIEINFNDPDTPLEFNLDGHGQVMIEGPAEFAGTHDLPVKFSDIALPEGTHFLAIQGDIDQITGFDSFCYNGGVESIDGLRHLTALQKFSPGINFNDILDLSNNKQLTDLSLTWVQLPSWFTLPETHNIRHFGLEVFDGTEHHVITTEEFDAIIDNLYRNAVEKSIANGILSAYPIAEISDSAHEKLITLRDTYGWNIEIEGYWD